MFFCDLIKNNIAHKKAGQIGVYDAETNNKLGIINLNNLQNSTKNPNYLIGIISDAIPNNDISSDNENNIQTCVINALKFFKEKKVDFTLGLGNNGAIYHLDLKNKYYPCRGNIDKKLFSLKEWNDSINNNEVHFYDINKNGSYYFKIQNYVFIILSSEYNENGKYEYELIKWLHTLLDKYRNNTVFVALQEPFYHKAGNVYGVGIKRSYIANLIDYKNDYNSFALLNQLNNYYLNSIWLNGFTRFPFEMQKLTKYCNISFYDNLHEIKSAYNIHIPSCSCSKDMSINNDNEVTLLDNWNTSQGYLMELYDDCIILNGIKFKENGYFINKYFPLVTYQIKLKQHEITSNLNLI